LRRDETRPLRRPIVEWRVCIDPYKHGDFDDDDYKTPRPHCRHERVERIEHSGGFEPVDY
jgi:hypothetical protein